tara:strand:- start:61 stop:447 length:387 start_codon:yes stop_codon:yes gene_type:complete
MAQIYKFAKKHDAFNVGITEELNDFEEQLTLLQDNSQGVFTTNSQNENLENGHSQIIKCIGLIAQCKNVSNDNRLKACALLENHSPITRVVIATMQEIHGDKFNDAVLKRAAQIVQQQTGLKAVSYFK